MDNTPIGTGDPRADSAAERHLVDIVTLHRAPLLAQVVRLTGGDRGWAEDVVQETFVRAWRHLDRMTATHGSVRGWLNRVAYNLVMDGYRAARSRPWLATDDLAGEPEAAVPDCSDRVVLSLLLSRALADLRPEHRAALTETYLNDRTAVQAAAFLGAPVGTVKSRVFHGLRHLRAALEPDALAS